MLDNSDMGRLADWGRDHHREMLTAAKTELLLRHAAAERPGLRVRLLLTGGGVLIALGQKLKAYARRGLVAPCEPLYSVKSALPRS
jgi:hypothetical protein